MLKKITKQVERVKKIVNLKASRLLVGHVCKAAELTLLAQAEMVGILGRKPEIVTNTVGRLCDVALNGLKAVAKVKWDGTIEAFEVLVEAAKKDFEKFERIHKDLEDAIASYTEKGAKTVEEVEEAWRKAA